MFVKAIKIIFLLIINLLFFQLYLYQQVGVIKPNLKGTLIKVSSNIDVNVKELSSQLIEKEINEFRIQNNLEYLVNYPPLCTLAIQRAIEIKTDWSHDGFEKRQDEIYTKYCNDKNIICTSAGENLAKGQFGDENNLVQQWIDSPEHKENMLGDYNVQCVAVNDNHYVSLFAKTIDTDEIKKAQEQKLNSFVDYDYEKVIFWENQVIVNEKYLDNWKNANENELYNKKDVEKLVKNINAKIDIANDLWDGITNQKITFNQEIVLQEEYFEISRNTSELSIKLNSDAFKKCKDKEYENCEVFNN